MLAKQRARDFEALRGPRGELFWSDARSRSVRGEALELLDGGSRAENDALRAAGTRKKDLPEERNSQKLHYNLTQFWNERARRQSDRLGTRLKTVCMSCPRAL